jgi:O-antigen/teichoic acid export membrane protein
MISKQFFKSSIIYSLVGSLPYISGIILIPLFTVYLTPQQFGVNALYYSMMVFFLVLAGFGMDSFIGVYYYEYKDKKQKLRELMGTVLLFSLIIGLFLIIFMGIAGPFAFHLLWPEISGLTFFPFGLITLMTAIFSAAFKSYTSLLINQQRIERFFWMNILNFLLTIGISYLLLYLFPFTLYGPLLGRLIPMTISFLLSVIFISAEFGLKINNGLFRPLLSFCIPILVFSLLVWVVNNIDRFVITHFIPDTTFVGIFDIAVKITLFIELIQTGLMNTINPKIFRIWKDQDLRESTVEVNRYYNGFTALTILLIPVILISVPLLLPAVIKKDIYYQSLIYLPVLSLGFATRGWFYMFMSPIYYFKKTKVLPKIFLFSACFQVVCSILLIKYFGIIGAVWANFLVKPVQALVVYSESRKIFKFSFNRWKILYLPLIFIFMGIIFEILSNQSTRLYFTTAQLLISIVLVFFAYRNELIPLFQKRFNL